MSLLMMSIKGWLPLTELIGLPLRSSKNLARSWFPLHSPLIPMLLSPSALGGRGIFPLRHPFLSGFSLCLLPHFLDFVVPLYAVILKGKSVVSLLVATAPCIHALSLLPRYVVLAASAVGTLVHPPRLTTMPCFSPSGNLICWLSLARVSLWLWWMGLQ